MFRNVYRQILHQCMQGGVQFLAVEATHEALGHVVDISYQCKSCGQRATQATCPVNGTTGLTSVQRTPPPSWLPVLKAVVKVECPACRAAIDIADTIANDPQASAQERKPADEFSTGATILGCLALLVIGISAIASGKGSAT